MLTLISSLTLTFVSEKKVLPHLRQQRQQRERTPPGPEADSDDSEDLTRRWRNHLCLWIFQQVCDHDKDFT